MDKLFLIDAYALIYRAYFAFIKNPRINSKGLNTSPIMGFCNTLHEVLEKEKPTYIAVAFDPHGPTFRHEAYEPYKAQREKTPEDISAAVPIIMDILKAMNIEIFIMPGFEADDVIGTLAKQAAQMNVDTFMLTPDKDYGQLVDDHIYMYKPRFGSGYDVMGVKEVTEKYGIDHPEQVIDLLALMGDSADNFPGCPGVGEKTAVKLINQFGSIEQSGRPCRRHSHLKIPRHDQDRCTHHPRLGKNKSRITRQPKIAFHFYGTRIQDAGRQISQERRKNSKKGAC